MNFPVLGLFCDDVLTGETPHSTEFLDNVVPSLFIFHVSADLGLKLKDSVYV